MATANNKSKMVSFRMPLAWSSKLDAVTDGNKTEFLNDAVKVAIEAALTKMLIDTDEQLCKKCGEIKGISEFRWEAKNQSPATTCKQCKSEYDKARSKRNK